MLALWAYIPGEIIFQALKDGEPLAYALVIPVIAAIVIGLIMKSHNRAKSTA